MRQIALALLSIPWWVTPALAETADVAADDPWDAPAVKRPRAEARGLEGGVTLGMATESFSSSIFGTGPRLDVGVGVAPDVAVVVGESARFALYPSGHLRVMAFDLQAGVAYGAPYLARTGFGVVFLAGAERLSTSTGVEALMTWAATASLGLRGSVAIGPVDAWIGLDGMARSSTIET